MILIDGIEGRELARKMGCKVVETSAKIRLNVDESFASIVREIRRYNRVSHPSTTPHLFLHPFIPTPLLTRLLTPTSRTNK